MLLAGLILNSTLGWWWADAAAALAIAGIAVREGINAWRGDACCTIPAAAPEPGAAGGNACCEGCQEP